jgi:hypothetical protein
MLEVLVEVRLPDGERCDEVRRQIVGPGAREAAFVFADGRSDRVDDVSRSRGRHSP